jgi:ribosomal protein S18 acetylase RimI-like enzyme
MEASTSVLPAVEAYCDTVPRADALVEQVGPFTLFIKAAAGSPYYARPSLGATQFAVADVARVRERQRECRIPQTFEWIAEVSPALASVVRESRLTVLEHPLMILDVMKPSAPPDVAGLELRPVTDDDDLPLLKAVADVAFKARGTAVGAEGIEAAVAAVQTDRAAIAAHKERLRTARTVTVAAFLHGRPVGVGSHQPVGDVTEIVGVAVLPMFRRRGIAAALTLQLAKDGAARGIKTVFLSADDEPVARIYSCIGFRRIATACTAEPNIPQTDKL